jgi:hypothetical protein
MVSSRRSFPDAVVTTSNASLSAAFQFMLSPHEGDAWPGGTGTHLLLILLVLAGAYSTFGWLTL